MSRITSSKFQYLNEEMILDSEGIQVKEDESNDPVGMEDECAGNKACKYAATQDRTADDGSTRGVWLTVPRPTRSVVQLRVPPHPHRADGNRVRVS